MWPPRIVPALARCHTFPCPDRRVPSRSQSRSGDRVSTSDSTLFLLNWPIRYIACIIPGLLASWQARVDQIGMDGPKRQASSEQERLCATHLHTKLEDRALEAVHPSLRGVRSRKPRQGPVSQVELRSLPFVHANQHRAFIVHRPSVLPRPHPRMSSPGPGSLCTSFFPPLHCV